MANNKSQMSIESDWSSSDFLGCGEELNLTGIKIQWLNSKVICHLMCHTFSWSAN